jgi:hypothetical protein
MTTTKAKAAKAAKKSTPAKTAQAAPAQAPAPQAKTAKTKPEKAKPTDTRKITILAEKCPSKPGTRRAERWKQLKTGMTVSEAGELGVPRVYLERMQKAGHLKLGG